VRVALNHLARALVPTLFKFLPSWPDAVQGTIFLYESSGFRGRFLKAKLCLREQICRLCFQVTGSQATVFWIDLDANAVSSGPHGRHHCRSGPAEWVQNGVLREGEHADKACGQLHGKRSGMLFGRTARYGPNLLEPAVKDVLVDPACVSLLIGRFPVSARLALPTQRERLRNPECGRVGPGFRCTSSGSSRGAT
jgi:hypothetical protein